MIVALMTVKYRIVNISVTYCHTIMRVLLHYLKDLILIELSHLIWLIF